jgi:hypothetical protein
MEQQKSPPTCVPEFNGRGVWFFKENRGDGSIGKAVFKAIAAKLGCSPDSLLIWP